LVIPFFPHRTTRRLTVAGLITIVLFCACALSSAQQPAASLNDLVARAAAARQQQDLPLAIQLYKEANALDPSWQEGWWYLGVLQYTSNQFPDAIDAFNHLLELAPQAVPALALRGLSEFETAAYKNSLRDLELAFTHGAASDPRNEQIIRFHLALLLTQAGRFQDALEQYRYFATHHVDAPDLMIGISLAGMRIPSLPKDVQPEKRDIFEAAGKAGYTFLSGDGDAADDLFLQLFAQHPSVPKLHFLYGLLLFAKHPELAVEQFRRELLVSPDSEDVNALFAFTLVITGRFAEALEPARRAYASAPDMELAQIALGRAMAEIGDTGRAAELLQQVIAHDPENVEAHLGLLSIYSRIGNKEGMAHEREICRKLSS
jgi:tetratricopeptide (TPR) repeat protein